jgi:hypothetical protein
VTLTLGRSRAAAAAGAIRRIETIRADRTVVEHRRSSSRDVAFGERRCDSTFAESIANRAALARGWHWSRIEALRKHRGLTAYLPGVSDPNDRPGRDRGRADPCRTPSKKEKRTMKLGTILAVSVVAILAAGACPRTASATGEYGACNPSAQIIWTGNNLQIDCASPVWYYWSDGSLQSASHLVINSADAGANFNTYVSMANAALLGGKTLWIWPNTGIPHTADTVHFQDLKIKQ